MKAWLFHASPGCSLASLSRCFTPMTFWSSNPDVLFWYEEASKEEHWDTYLSLFFFEWTDRRSRDNRPRLLVLWVDRTWASGAFFHVGTSVSTWPWMRWRAEYAQMRRNASDSFLIQMFNIGTTMDSLRDIWFESGSATGLRAVSGYVGVARSGPSPSRRSHAGRGLRMELREPQDLQPPGQPPALPLRSRAQKARKGNSQRCLGKRRRNIKE